MSDALGIVIGDVSRDRSAGRVCKSGLYFITRVEMKQ
jgi:hypothetical protein